MILLIIALLNTVLLVMSYNQAKHTMTFVDDLRLNGIDVNITE